MRTKTIVLLTLALLLMVGLVFGLPPLLKTQIEKELKAVLGESVAVERLSFNPLVGTAKVVGIAVGEHTSLNDFTMDIKMWPLLGRHLHIQTLTASDLVLPVQVGDSGFKVAGYELPQSESGTAESQALSKKVEWRVSVDQLILETVELALDYQGRLQQVSIQTLSLGTFDTELPGVTPITAALRLNGVPVQFDGSFSMQAGAQHLSGDLNVEGLELKKLSHFLQSSSFLGDVSGQLSLQQNIQIDNDASGVRIVTSGDLSVTEPSIESGFSAASLQHSGKVVVDLTHPEPVIKAESQLVVQGLVSRDFGAIESADWNGNVDFSSNLKYRVDGIALLSKVRPLGIGVINRVTAEGLLIEALVEDGASVSLELLEVSGLDIAIERAANGELAVLSKLSGNYPSEKTLAIPSINVQTFQLRDSKVEFIDRSVAPLVDIEIGRMTANAYNFSLLEPFTFDFVGHHQTETDLETDLKIKGNVGIHSQTGTVDIVLANFELHEIASYLGSGIRSGRLQLNADFKMKQGHLMAKNKVHIQNIKMDDRTQAGGSDQMSLATALFLLKDKNDVVELEVPIETDFDSFEIGFGDIFQQAMLSAARTTAVTYAQYALQPYGSLLLAKDLLGVMSRPRFDSVGFEPGSAVLNSQAQAYVEKMSGLLMNKPELTVTVCGYADMSELPLLSEAETNTNKTTDTQGTNNRSDVAQIKTLALARSHRVRDVLEAGGVTSKRLYACTATVGTNGSLPRVEVVL